MISGINHITFAVRDLAESLAFYTDVLGLRPVVRWSKGAYLLAGTLWVALALDPQVRGEALPEYTHVAFTVSPQDYAAIEARVLQSGAAIWQENQTEGPSIYFVDPNGHKLEIHASDLEARIRTARAQPWDTLEWFI